MAGNIIEYVSPPVTNFRDNITINVCSDECVGPELLGADLTWGSAVWSANLLIFVPLVTAQPLVVSQFFWMNGATAADNTDVGIYNFAGTSKLGSTGSTANSGASQIQVVDVANFTLPGNARYWLALGCDSATQTYRRGNLIVNGMDFLGIKQQAAGWSSGLPSSITPATPTLASMPYFGFTGASVI